MQTALPTTSTRRKRESDPDLKRSIVADCYWPNPVHSIATASVRKSSHPFASEPARIRDLQVNAMHRTPSTYDVGSWPKDFVNLEESKTYAESL